MDVIRSAVWFWMPAATFTEQRPLAASTTVARCGRSRRKTVISDQLSVRRCRHEELSTAPELDSQTKFATSNCSSDDSNPVRDGGADHAISASANLQRALHIYRGIGRGKSLCRGNTRSRGKPIWDRDLGRKPELLLRGRFRLRYGLQTLAQRDRVDLQSALRLYRRKRRMVALYVGHPRP